jgi:hypothetical protein
MKTQAWAWLAAGVVALGLNRFYHDGGFAWAHGAADRIESRSSAVLALATGRAQQFLEQARVATLPDETDAALVETALARAQTGIARTENTFDRWQAVSDRQEAKFVRLEATRTRLQAVQARLACRRSAAVTVSPVVLKAIRIESCPRVRVNVPRIPRIDVPTVSIPEISIPRVNIPKISVPAIHVELQSAGPV